MRKIVVAISVLSSCLLWADEMVQPIRVGLLLPLQVESIKRDHNMDRFADFYTGALLATYEMQATGQQVELYTYDVGKSSSQLDKVLSYSELDSVDIIIGPAYPQQVRSMSDWVLGHRKMALLPFASEVPMLAENPYLMQYNPSTEKESQVLSSYLAQMDTMVRCVFVEADSLSVPESVYELQQSIKGEGINYVYTTLMQIMHDSLAYLLADSLENVLLMNTERFSSLKTIMPQLSRAAQGKQLTLISRYSWQGNPIILSQIYSTVFKADSTINDSIYNALYERFITRPIMMDHPRYDLLGYDLMSCVLHALSMYRMPDNVLEMDAIWGLPYKGVQSDIQFERVDWSGGFVNTAIHIERVP